MRAHLPRLICLLPPALGAVLAVAGHLDPLTLPLLGAAALGFALRAPTPLDLALLAAATAALCTPTPALMFAGWAALLALGLAGARRLAFAPVLIGGGAVGAAALLDPGGPVTVLRQLRLLALCGGGVLAIGGLRALGGPAGRRAAALALALGMWGLCRGAAAAWPDGWRLAAPYIAWAGPLLALSAAAWIARGGGLAFGAGLALAGPALLGALSGTALGVEGAAWALTGPLIAAGLADDEGRLPGRFTALAVAGLPGALPAVGAGAGLWAAATAIHPAPLRLAAGLTLLGGLAALALIARRSTPPAQPRRDLALGVGLVALGLLVALGPRPTAAGAEAVAAAIDGHRLPIDDMRGWRRLSRLDAPPPPGPPDAGVGD